MSDFDGLIDNIYEAALVPTLWSDVLTRISEPIGRRGGFLFVVRGTYHSAVSSESLGDIYERFVREGWAARDPRMQRVLVHDHAGFVNDQDLLSDDEIRDNEVYSQFFRKNDIGYMAGTLIPAPSGESIAFAFQRHQDLGPVPRSDIDYLDVLRPHLARSALMANRLGFERARAQADALMAFGLPGAVLRGPGRIFAANALFEAMMPSTFQDRTHRLTIDDSMADSLFGEMLTELPKHIGSGVKSIAIAATAERVAMVVHVVPVRGAAHDIFNQATAVLIVTPGRRERSPRWQMPLGYLGKPCGASSGPFWEKRASLVRRNSLHCWQGKRFLAADYQGTERTSKNLILIWNFTRLGDAWSLQVPLYGYH